MIKAFEFQVYIFDQGSKSWVYIFDHTVGTANERLLLEVYIFDQGSKRYVYIFDQSLRILGVHFWSKVLESIFRSFVKSKVYIFDQGLRILSVHFWSYCRNGVCRADEQSVHFWSKVSFYRCTFLIKDFSQMICKVYIFDQGVGTEFARLLL